MIGNKPTIGIIGAGASGLVTAWLLEQDYQVTLFEKADYLGGHIATIPITVNGKTIHVEAGAEFFSDMMFGQFNKLLAILNVPVRKYPLSYTFYNTKSNETLVLPPLQEGHIIWRSCAPAHWFDLIHFKQFVDQGGTIVALQDTQITLRDYADEIGLPDSFKEQFLYPFFAASWGVTPQDIQGFAAYDIIKWALLNKPANIHTASWNEVVGGMSTYVKALASQLKNSTIYKNCSIDGVEYDGGKYILTGCNGNKYSFDHLIIATNAEIASSLLTRLESAASLKKALAKVEYFTAHIAIHSDPRLMPRHKDDWSPANIAYDNLHSALTICKDWMKNRGIFRSWITYNVWTDEPHINPEPLFASRTFRHPKVTPAYFEAQKELAHLQGKNNLWIVGFYTHDIDSHNSAIVSAIAIAKKLTPGSNRLFKLTS